MPGQEYQNRKQGLQRCRVNVRLHPQPLKGSYGSAYSLMNRITERTRVRRKRCPIEEPMLVTQLSISNLIFFIIDHFQP